MLLTFNIMSAEKKENNIFNLAQRSLDYLALYSCGSWSETIANIYFFLYQYKLIKKYIK